MKSDLSESLRLYAVTDRAGLPQGMELGAAVEEAILGGVTFVQLREKYISRGEKIVLAQEVKAVCHRYGVPFVIDDDVDVARIVGADGVHVGQDDAPVKEARSILGPDAIIGVSVQTVSQALLAQEDGADYLGVGTMMYTPTKPDAIVVSVEELSRICDSVRIPVIAIGGMSRTTIPRFSHTGVVGFAVVSALFSAPDIRAAAGELSSIIKELIV